MVAPVEQRELNIGETFVGTVQPLRTSTVGSPVEGRVVEFLVNEGDAVKAEAPLARLRTTSLDIQLAAAKAELTLRRQQLAELENGTRPEEIDQAQARMEAAKALMDFAQSRLKRTQSLFERNVASQDELQDQASAAEAAAKTYADRKLAWELAVQGPRMEQIEQARAQVAVQEETIRRLEDDIAEHTIRSPFNGYVTAEHTEVGQWISKGDPVADVVEISSVDVEVMVLETYLSQLEPGTEARVEISAIPGADWLGKVAAVVPQADVRSRSFPVKIRLENRPLPSGMMLKPGMFARVTLPVGNRRPALLVPKDALVLGKATVVYIAADNPRAPGQKAAGPVAVELGAAMKGLVEVRGPLKPGDLVVVEGNEGLFPGRDLQIVGPSTPSAPQASDKTKEDHLAPKSAGAKSSPPAAQAKQ
ncbi:MAG: efflux RND transporter periplasmic adaptor subunit [Planctomycetaceae bacterium]|nr:efflux RND transporter periplasmic adaptor subunit [Planctomycetaceae bacterium]